MKIIEQVSRGITENMKRAFLNVGELPNPITRREYALILAVATLLKSRGGLVFGVSFYFNQKIVVKYKL